MRQPVRHLKRTFCWLVDKTFTLLLGLLQSIFLKSCSYFFRLSPKLCRNLWASAEEKKTYQNRDLFFYQKLFFLKNVIFVERTVVESRVLFGHRSRQPPRRIENRTYFSSARGTRNEDQVRARAVVRLHRRVQRWREAEAGVRACRNWLCWAGVLLI